MAVEFAMEAILIKVRMSTIMLRQMRRKISDVDFIFIYNVDISGEGLLITRLF